MLKCLLSQLECGNIAKKYSIQIANCKGAESGVLLERKDSIMCPFDVSQVELISWEGDADAVGKLLCKRAEVLRATALVMSR